MAITVTKKPPVVALCDNVMLFEFTTDLPAETVGVYLLVQPHYYEGGIVTGTDKLFPQVPGSAQANLSEYLRSGLQSLKQFVYPEQGNAPWNDRTALVKKYKIRVQEIYMGESGEVIMTTFPLENRFVLRGKIPRWIKQKFYNQYANFLAWITNATAFLTLSPSTLITTTSMMQKLGFLVTWLPEAGEKLNLKVDLVFTDGTTGSFTTVQQSAEIAQYSLIEFCVGYAPLGLEGYINANHAGKILDSYSVTAMLGAVVKSEKKTYILDRSAHQGRHVFIFANSVGYYDTWMAKGSSELYSQFDHDVVQQQRAGITNNAEMASLHVESSDMIACRSGYYNLEFAQYLAEFFESREIYEDMGTYLVPVVINSARILRKKDGEGLYAVEFEYQLLNTHKVELG